MFSWLKNNSDPEKRGEQVRQRVAATSMASLAGFGLHGGKFADEFNERAFYRAVGQFLAERLAPTHVDFDTALTRFADASRALENVKDLPNDSKARKLIEHEAYEAERSLMALAFAPAWSPEAVRAFIDSLPQAQE